MRFNFEFEEKFTKLAKKSNFVDFLDKTANFVSFLCQFLAAPNRRGTAIWEGNPVRFFRFLTQKIF